MRRKYVLFAAVAIVAAAGMLLFTAVRGDDADEAFAELKRSLEVRSGAQQKQSGALAFDDVQFLVRLLKPESLPPRPTPGRELRDFELGSFIYSLRERCSSGEFAACDLAGAYCARRAALEGIDATAPVVLVNRLDRNRLRQLGCNVYHDELACEVGSNARCLRAESRASLAIGCQRGCAPCCSPFEDGSGLQQALQKCESSGQRDCAVSNLPPNEWVQQRLSSTVSESGIAQAWAMSPSERLAECRQTPAFCLALSELLENGPGPNLVGARKLAGHACASNPLLCHAVARMLSHGVGGPRDPGAARQAMMLLRDAHLAVGLELKECGLRQKEHCKASLSKLVKMAAAYAPQIALSECQQGSALACYGLASGMSENSEVAVEHVKLAYENLYPSCRDMLESCPGALLKCLTLGDLRACLRSKLFGVPQMVRGVLGSESGRVTSQLKKMCLAGELDACVVEL